MNIFLKIGDGDRRQTFSAAGLAALMITATLCAIPAGIVRADDKSASDQPRPMAPTRSASSKLPACSGSI